MVASDAATRLTSSTLNIMKSDSIFGCSEAVRRAMLSYMDDKADPLNAYPAFLGVRSRRSEKGAMNS